MKFAKNGKRSQDSVSNPEKLNQANKRLPEEPNLLSEGSGLSKRAIVKEISQGSELSLMFLKTDRT